MLNYFSEKCLEISTLILKYGTEIGNRNQNRNSDEEIENEIKN
jgi:hypothetical protein